MNVATHNRMDFNVKSLCEILVGINQVNLRNTITYLDTRSEIGVAYLNLTLARNMAAVSTHNYLPNM